MKMLFCTKLRVPQEEVGRRSWITFSLLVSFSDASVTFLVSVFSFLMPGHWWGKDSLRILVKAWVYNRT